MSCGVSQPGHAVLIVEPNTLQPLADNRVGEVWASGPSIAHGYWRNPEASAKTFVQHAGRTWLRTGDLGFQIGRASCRERVCQYVEISVVVVSLKKKHIQ